MSCRHIVCQSPPQSKLEGGNQNVTNITSLGRKETKNEEAGAVELKGIFFFFYFSAFGIYKNEKKKVR